jgi:Holliday junction resolvase
MAINSKKKGNRNERNLCKLWQIWTGWEHNRVPASGGLRWKKSDNISGDIICTEPGVYNFKFSIETKFYKDLDFVNLLNGNKNCDIRDFWNQTLSDASRANKTPILMMRCNNMKADMYFVIIEASLYKLIKKDLPKIYGSLKFNNDWVLINSVDLFNSKFNSIYEKI